jgi:hypothetical protein
MAPIVGEPSTSSAVWPLPLPLKVAVSDAPGTEGEELQLDGPLQMTLDVPSQVPLTACDGAADSKIVIAAIPNIALPAHILAVFSRREVQ